MIPKYLVISNEIIQKIESGELQPGDKIPSENELILSHKISNTTARKCLLELEHQGWANRVKGKGTFVLNRSEDKHLTRVLGSFHAYRESFNDNLIKEGLTPKNIILEKIILESGISSKINNRHFIIEGPILKLHRLRYGNDLLLKDETRYVSLTLCPKINLLDLDIPLLKIYESKYKLQIGSVERSLSTLVINPKDPTNYFGNDKPMASFNLDGAVICTNSKVVEIEKSLYHGDKYKFSISTKPNLISGKDSLKT